MDLFLKLSVNALRGGAMCRIENRFNKKNSERQNKDNYSNYRNSHGKITEEHRDEPR